MAGVDSRQNLFHHQDHGASRQRRIAPIMSGIEEGAEIADLLAKRGRGDNLRLVAGMFAGIGLAEAEFVGEMEGGAVLGQRLPPILFQRMDGHGAGVITAISRGNDRRGWSGAWRGTPAGSPSRRGRRRACGWWSSSPRACGRRAWSCIDAPPRSPPRPRAAPEPR